MSNWTRGVPCKLRADLQQGVEQVAHPGAHYLLRKYEALPLAVLAWMA